jgi:hypothetical protein
MFLYPFLFSGLFLDDGTSVEDDSYDFRHHNLSERLWKWNFLWSMLRNTAKEENEDILSVS